jgi:DEAD/DEAH box helicase domain-containing protein
MPRVITFDIETTNTFSDVGSNKPEDLDLAIVCIHDSSTDAYSSYLTHELPALWKVLEHTDMIVGFNSNHFDLPLLNKYYPDSLLHIRSIDLLEDIYASIGRRIKLDVVAEATLGTKKSGSGLQSLVWWRNGEVDKVRQYCMKDVEITRRLYDYAIKNQKLHYKDLGKKKDIPINTSGWVAAEKAALTHTLPF